MSPVLVNPARFGDSGGGGTLLISDSFNRADSATSLGTTDTGETWTPLNSTTWGITGNKAYKVGSSSQGYAVVESAVADNLLLQVTLRTPSSGGGITFRASDSTHLWFVENSGVLFKVNGGAPANIYTLPAAYTTDGDVMKIRLVGNVFTFYKNGAANGSYTDTGNFNLTATKHGLRDFGGNTRLDDFSIATL